MTTEDWNEVVLELGKCWVWFDEVVFFICFDKWKQIVV